MARSRVLARKPSSRGGFGGFSSSGGWAAGAGGIGADGGGGGGATGFRHGSGGRRSLRRWRRPPRLGPSSGCSSVPASLGSFPLPGSPASSVGFPLAEDPLLKSTGRRLYPPRSLRAPVGTALARHVVDDQRDALQAIGVAQPVLEVE